MHNLHLCEQVPEQLMAKRRKCLFVHVISDGEEEEVAARPLPAAAPPPAPPPSPAPRMTTASRDDKVSC